MLPAGLAPCSGGWAGRGWGCSDGRALRAQSLASGRGCLGMMVEAGSSGGGLLRAPERQVSTPMHRHCSRLHRGPLAAPSSTGQRRPSPPAPWRPLPMTITAPNTSEQSQVHVALQLCTHTTHTHTCPQPPTQSHGCLLCTHTHPLSPAEHMRMRRNTHDPSLPVLVSRELGGACWAGMCPVAQRSSLTSGGAFAGRALADSWGPPFPRPPGTHGLHS